MTVFPPDSLIYLLTRQPHGGVDMKCESTFNDAVNCCWSSNRILNAVIISMLTLQCTVIVNTQQTHTIIAVPFSYLLTYRDNCSGCTACDSLGDS